MTGATRRRVLLLGAVALVVILFFALGGAESLTLEAVKARRLALTELYAERPLTVLAAYFGLYVLVAALSLPGAVPLGLIGGAVFGFGAGLVVVSFASSVGAALACALARHVLRDWVQARFGSRLAAIDDGLAREGIFYLLFLRLTPAFPFFLVNLAMGLTAMPLTTFYWVSQLGMLPGTAVFINAGARLGALDSLSDVLSFRTMWSLALLGLFPLLARRLTAAWRARAGRR